MWPFFFFNFDIYIKSKCMIRSPRCSLYFNDFRSQIMEEENKKKTMISLQ